MKLRMLLPVAVLACAFCGDAPRSQNAAAPPATTERTWSENFDYQAEIDGALSPSSRFFGTSGRPSLLLLAPELKQPVVLQVSGREVLMVGQASIKEGPGPDQILLADTEIHGPPMPYTMEGDSVIFFHQGKRVKIGRKPAMVGTATEEDLLRQLPIYRKGMEAYAPADADTVYLKSYKYPVKVEVFFGSWCPHCKQMVPRFLKSVSVASNPNIQVSFIGVPNPPFTDYPLAKEKSVTGVPTFIVYAENREVGRISTVPGDSSVEHELVKVLFAYQQTKG